MTIVPASQDLRPPLLETCPFVTFYSFKGGVGRSMTLINVASLMADHGLRVLVIDLDLEAPGLSYLERSGNDKASTPGFVDLLQDAVRRGEEADLFTLSPSDVVDKYSKQFVSSPADTKLGNGEVRIMPAGAEINYAQNLTSLDLPRLYEQGYGLPLARKLKLVIQEAQIFDLVLVDSRTGFSDESGMCTRDLADAIMVVSALNEQNRRGTKNFLKLLRSAIGDREVLLDVLLSPIPNGEDELVDQLSKQALDSYASAWGDPIEGELSVPYHPRLALSELPRVLERRHGYLYDAYVSIEKRVRDLAGLGVPKILKDIHAHLNQYDYDDAARLLYYVDSYGADVLRIFYQVVDSPAFREPADGVERIVKAFAERGDANVVRNIFTTLAVRNLHEQDIPAAEQMYKRALEVDSAHAATLRSYANFLYHHSKNVDKAQEFYVRAVEADPDDANLLSDYAAFLHHGRKDLNQAETFHERATRAAPSQARILGNYANFLYYEKKEFDRAEDLYRRAIEADPKNVNGLCGYALLLCDGRGAWREAESFLVRANEAAPNDPNNIGNLARAQLANEKIEQGLQAARRALELASYYERTALDAECNVYRYCFADADERATSLSELCALVDAGIRTEEWDFSRLLDLATQREHPEAKWLRPLAEVVAGRQPAASLDEWPAWQRAKERIAAATATNEPDESPERES